MEKKLLEEINNIRNIMGLEVIKEQYDTLPKIIDVYPNVSFHPRTKEDRLNPNILKDIQKAAENAGIKVTINYAKTGHDKFTDSGNISRHWKGLAVDVSSIEGSGWSSRADARKKGNLVAIDKFVSELGELGYKIDQGESQAREKVVLSFGTAGHDDHIHVSNMNTGQLIDTEDEVDIENIEDDMSMEELINLKDYLVKKGKEVGKEKVNKLVDALKKLQSMKIGDIGGKIKDVITTASKSISELE